MWHAKSAKRFSEKIYLGYLEFLLEAQYLLVLKGRAAHPLFLTC
jgi:hypothetical protein